MLVSPLESWRPLLWGILDPSLKYSRYYTKTEPTITYFNPVACMKDFPHIQETIFKKIVIVYANKDF